MKVRSLKLKRRAFTLYPLSDVHWPAHEHEKLQAWRKAVLEDDEALVTLGGDMIDFCRTTLRSYLRAYTSDSNSMKPIHEMAMSQVEGLADFLRPVAKQGKILMTSVGNHSWQFNTGRMSDQELALQMGVGETWVGALGIQRVSLKERQDVILALHHDAGRKGGTASTDVLAFVHWSNACAADIYIAGHTHRQYAGIFNTRITIGEGEKIGAKHLVFLRTGAYLKGYGDSVIDPAQPYESDYAEEKMLPPSVLGMVSCRVEATPTGKLLYTLQQRTF
jgi:hypothetical protein